jgi:hypothetical protein
VKQSKDVLPPGRAVLIGRPAVQKKEASEPANESAIKKGLLKVDGFLQEPDSFQADFTFSRRMQSDRLEHQKQVKRH